MFLIKKFIIITKAKVAPEKSEKSGPKQKQVKGMVGISHP